MIAGAALNGLCKAEYARRRIKGRPLKAEKHLYKQQQALERQHLREAAEADAQRPRKAERAAEDKRRMAQAMKWEKARKRREEAEALAKAAGGATAWFQGMSAKQREKWSDLETELVNGERLVKEAAEVWQQGQGRLHWVK